LADWLVQAAELILRRHNDVVNPTECE
jgi:hypothetical protein